MSTQYSCYYLVVEIESDLQQSFSLNCSTTDQLVDYSCIYAEVQITDTQRGDGVPSAQTTIDCNGPGYSWECCKMMELDLQNVESVEWICGGSQGCSWSHLWCPSDAINSCHLMGDGIAYIPATNMLYGVQVYVDESYTFGSVNIECDSDYECGTVDINCEGHKSVNQANMMYDDSDGEYYCSNDGASYCCPIGNCSVFNDPEMGFNSSLIDVDQYINTTNNGSIEIVDVNDTVELIQDTVSCTADFCVIRCGGLLSCAFTSFAINSSDAIVECNGPFSCLGASVYFDEHLWNHGVRIYCLGMSYHGMP